MNAETEKFVMPAVSLKEQPASYTFTFTLPGIGKKDADLHVEGRTLTLKTHATYQAPAGFKLVAQEFDRPNYAVSVDLPELCDLATVSGALANRNSGLYPSISREALTGRGNEARTVAPSMAASRPRRAGRTRAAFAAAGSATSRVNGASPRRRRKSAVCVAYISTGAPSRRAANTVERGQEAGTG